MAFAGANAVAHNVHTILHVWGHYSKACGQLLVVQTNRKPPLKHTTHTHFLHSTRACAASAPSALIYERAARATGTMYKLY